MLAIYMLAVDRLEYLQRTLKGLEEQNEEDFVLFLLSQGSNEETNQWLTDYKCSRKMYEYKWSENKGISHGSNFLINEIANRMPQYNFDLIAKVDNDVETITPNWLDRCVATAKQFNILCSPLVLGLSMFPEGVPGYATQMLNNEKVRLTRHIGGIVHMAKADLHLSHLYSPNMTMAMDQDTTLSRHALRQYYLIGYLENVQVKHMDSTEGQVKRYPEYFKKKRKWERETYVDADKEG